MCNLCGARDAAERWNPLRRTVDEWHVECSLVSLRRYTRGPATRPSKTGGERPQKTDSKFDPLQTSGARGRERLKPLALVTKLVRLQTSSP
jgi:hypothetical protein